LSEALTNPPHHLGVGESFLRHLKPFGVAQNNRAANPQEILNKKSIFEKRLIMKTIQLNIPDTVDLNDREAKMLLASRLYEKGKLTLGQAAELVGLSKRAFMEILGDYDVSIFNYPLSELENDIKNARDYSL
jgi:predicted HTH domain antitoxin